MTADGHVKAYLKEIQELYLSGEATEPSYYPSLKKFLEESARQNNKPIEVIPNPKKMEGGLPDFLLKTDGKTIGYIEAKDVVTTDLNSKAETEQLKRYRRCLPNLILTNFLEFITFRDGIRKKHIKICDIEALVKRQQVKT